MPSDLRKLRIWRLSLMVETERLGDAGGTDSGLEMRPSIVDFSGCQGLHRAAPCGHDGHTAARSCRFDVGPPVGRHLLGRADDNTSHHRTASSRSFVAHRAKAPHTKRYVGRTWGAGRRAPVDGGGRTDRPGAGGDVALLALPGGRSAQLPGRADGALLEQRGARLAEGAERWGLAGREQAGLTPAVSGRSIVRGALLSDAVGERS